MSRSFSVTLLLFSLLLLLGTACGRTDPRESETTYIGKLKAQNTMLLEANLALQKQVLKAETTTVSTGVSVEYLLNQNKALQENLMKSNEQLLNAVVVLAPPYRDPIVVEPTIVSVGDSSDSSIQGATNNSQQLLDNWKTMYPSIVPSYDTDFALWPSGLPGRITIDGRMIPVSDSWFEKVVSDF